MNWNPIYENYGVIRTDRTSVRVYKDQYNYMTVSVGAPVDRAIWANGHLIVHLDNGLVRRYRDYLNYEVIR